METPTKNIFSKIQRTCFFVLLFFWNIPSNGQPVVSIVCRNDAVIGTITAGFSQRVQPASVSAAKFEVHVTKAMDVIIQFTLPQQLSGPGGGSGVDLRFEHDCARWSSVDNVSSATSFDPREPLTIHIEPNQAVYLWVGTVASALVKSQAGAYSGSITCTVQQISQ